MRQTVLRRGEAEVKLGLSLPCLRGWSGLGFIHPELRFVQSRVGQSREQIRMFVDSPVKKLMFIEIFCVMIQAGVTQCDNLVAKVFA
jgi:hypothetical protein